MFSLILVVPQYRVMSVGEGVFGRFPGSKKKSEVRRQSESEGARQAELMDSGGLCGESGRGRVRRVLRVQQHFVEAGLGRSAPVLLLVRFDGHWLLPVYVPPWELFQCSQ